MRFSEFRRFQPKGVQNVFVFACEDEFLLEESRSVWSRIFGGAWRFDRLHVKEFQEIPFSQLMDDAMMSSLFATSRAIIVRNAEKTAKERQEDLAAIRDIPNSSLKIVLALTEPRERRKPLPAWTRAFPTIEIDEVTTQEATRWLVDDFRLAPDLARYLVENVGPDLCQLRTEVEKLRTYTGNERPIESRDVDVLILRNEQFGRFELDDAIMARDRRKAAQVIGAMLDEGEQPLVILVWIARVWRQLFIGKSLAGSRGAIDVATAAGVPQFKARDFAASCRQFEWKQLATGFRELLYADRAFKTSSPNPGGYFDVMLWKLIG